MRSWATNIKVAKGIQQVSSAGKQENNCSVGGRDSQTPEYGGAKETFYQEQSPCFKCRQSAPQCLLQNPVSRPARRSDFEGQKVHRLVETTIPGDTGIGGTKMHTHETITGRDPGIRSDLGYILTAWVRHQANVQYLL